MASNHARNVTSVQVRTFWGRSWKYAWYYNHHNRVNRREVLHDLAKDYRGQYVLIKRMANHRSGKHQFWKDWKDSLRQSHYDRDDVWRDSKRHRHYWDSEMSELVKRIEKDPYNFLFGRSNAYLQMGKGWSSFCRSFLDPEGPSEQKRDTSSAQESPVKSTPADIYSEPLNGKADGDFIPVKSYKPSDVNSLQYDPISGRMKSVEQPATTVAQDETKDGSYINDSPVKVAGEKHSGRIGIPGQQFSKSKETIPPAQSLRPQVNRDSVFYMAGPTEDSTVALKDTSSITTQRLECAENAPNGQKKRLDYEPKEVKEDDVDLLRASDIRASFFAGETKQELAEKKKQAREAMEKEYTLATEHNLDDEILRDLRQKKDATTIALRASLDDLLEDTRHFINNVRLLTNDLQNASERVEAVTNNSMDTLRILAFDSVNSQVVCAETTSSMHGSESIRSAADVLLHLNNPAKFLPHLAKMRADGYEIVSGGSDILIFRKIASKGSESGMSGSSDIEHLTISTEDRLGSVADSLDAKDGYLPPQPSSNTDRPKSRIVQRQETVFTGGPPNWSPYNSPSSSSIATEELECPQTESSNKSSTASKLGKGLRRIVLSGVATAGTFYAIGVVCEYFVTGGQDGLGPEGFSEFEAERRRRE